MDIKSISTLSIPQTQIYQKTQADSSAAKHVQTTNQETKQQKHSYKKLPYAAAGIVLAGLGIYASRNKLAKFFKSKDVKNLQNEVKEQKNETAEGLKDKIEKNVKTIHDEIREMLSPNVLPQNKNNTIDTMKIILPEGTVKVSPNLNNAKKEAEQVTQQVVTDTSKKAQLFLPLPQKKERFVCIGFENGKPVYKKLDKIVAKNVKPAKSAFEEAKKELNLLNDEVIARIMKIKKDKASEVDRIITENTKDGHVNLKIMRKVAHDFSTDEAGRGADRFHQAAEILEQSYVREFIKKDGTVKKGLYNLYDFMKTDSELFSIYTQMPLEEAANRLNYLSYNDLLLCRGAKDMTSDVFFDKMFARLVEKTQFKNYNKAHEGVVVKVGA